MRATDCQARRRRGVAEYAAMSDVLLRGCRLWGRDEDADVLVRDGAIAEIGSAVEAPEVEEVDVAGRLVLPGLVEAHCHLDKTLFGGPWVPHSAGDALADRIANDRRRRRELGIPDPDRIAALLERMVACGTTHVRSHTDIDPEVGLDGVAAVRTALARLDGRIDVQQVAFPQHGLLTNPGTAELLDEALREGVEIIGGIDPAGVDRDPVRHLDVLFDLAARHGAGVDLHLHDPGELGAWELELIAERTRDTGLGGRVTVSHAYGFSQLDAAHQDRLIERIAEAGVALVTAAVYSFPVPPLKRLRAAGVDVACGHDGICDLWGPYGSGDMLERAMHVAYRSTFRRDEDIELALDAATYGGARVLGLEAYGLDVGSVADLVVVPARTAAEAVVAHPPRDLVLKAGRPVARGGRLPRRPGGDPASGSCASTGAESSGARRAGVVAPDPRAVPAVGRAAPAAAAVAAVVEVEPAAGGIGAASDARDVRRAEQPQRRERQRVGEVGAARDVQLPLERQPRPRGRHGERGDDARVQRAQRGRVRLAPVGRGAQDRVQVLAQPPHALDDLGAAPQPRRHGGGDQTGPPGPRDERGEPVEPVGGARGVAAPRDRVHEVERGIAGDEVEAGHRLPSLMGIIGYVH